MTSTNALIKKTILAGIAAGAHKGDLQDAVIAALGGRALTLDEAAHAQRVLDASGYEAPHGFKPRYTLDAVAGAFRTLRPRRRS